MISYDFPTITNISDILPHIEGRKEFRITDHGWYKVVRYMVSLEDTFEWDNSDPVGSAIRRECRGLAFCAQTGEIISRPYHKFFNVGERAETQVTKLNLYEPHIILEKLDGSMVRPIPLYSEGYLDGFRLGTKSGITDTSLRAERFIASKKHYGIFITKCLQKGTTPIFEWVGDRIVVEYNRADLILTAIRYTNSGQYVPYSTMVQYASAYSIPTIRAVDSQLPTQNIELLVSQVRAWEGKEGVVMRFESPSQLAGHMVKIKADDYVLKHRATDSISNEKDVIRLIMLKQVDDVMPLLPPEKAERMLGFQKAVLMGLDDVASELVDLYLEEGGAGEYPTQKDFVEQFVKPLPPHLHHLMYGLRRGRGMRDMLVKEVLKATVSQTKIDKVRWMWGGAEW